MTTKHGYCSGIESEPDLSFDWLVLNSCSVCGIYGDSDAMLGREDYGLSR